MKKWKLAILTMILWAVLTYCKILPKAEAGSLRPPAPQLVNDDGESQIKLIDGTTIVFMDLTTWKKIVRYINESRPPETPDLKQTAIKNAIVPKAFFIQNYLGTPTNSP